MKGPSYDASLLILKATKLLLGLVFLGWLMIWIMVPTNTYRNIWTPKMRADTSSSYFGRQGTNILIYAFPIMFISVVGCIYIHMMKKRSDQSSKLSGSLEAWRKPFIVKGPLGIISTLELAFCLMFLALLVWEISMYIITGFGRMTKESAEEDGEKLWQAKLESASVRLGLVGNIACAFLFFPITRGSSLLPLVGLTSEASVKYHVWLGHIVIVLLTAHGLGYVILWISTKNISLMLDWATDGESYLAGEISLLAGLAMWATSFPRIRRSMFELFFYTHQLYVVFLVFYLLHVGMPFFSLILPAVYLFMVDRYLRFLQSRRRVRLVSVRLLPSESLELNFSKSPGFSYTPMSSVFINVPSVSSMQWHPFTVSSSSNFEPEKLSVIIKKEGSWTQKLYQKLNQPSLDRLDVSVEGPYSPISVNFLRHDSLVLVSGGSGIAPFISIVRELIHRSSTLGAPTPNVLLICCFKTSADLTMLDLLLPVATPISDLSKLQLRIEAFVTREKAPPASQKQIRTVWFKPSPSDLPIAPVLGPNGWLWLAAIIASSFVAFLVLVGILTRYHIYPIESTGSTYNLTTRSLINLFFICVCIAAASSAAVLWNKQRSSMEAKQVQVADGATPTTSPGSLFYNGERELESVPHESLAQATTVHYGKRPDLKKMILESEGSSVGVMASGPSELRRAAAAICASGVADNVHFESISFTW